MESTKPTILVVDDMPETIDLFNNILSGDYKIKVSLNGHDAIQLCQSEPIPELVLLDVVMPDIDGYSVCREIKANPISENIPVIFVSGLDSVEERLEGYNSGGNDYLTKPFLPDELTQKINQILQYKEAVNRYKQEAKMAMDTAMTAMSSSGELGVILQFLRNSFTCRGFTELANQILRALENYSLDGVVQIRATETINVASHAAVSPLEIAVFDKLKDEKRIFDFGLRTMFNYPLASVLIKNMPMDNPDLYGRVKDNVALLVEAADQKVKALETEALVSEQQTELVNVLTRSEDLLKQLIQEHHSHKDASKKVVDDLLLHIEEAFMYMGLTDEQEQSLLTMINKSVENMVELYESGIDLDNYIQSITEDIKKYKN